MVLDSRWRAYLESAHDLSREGLRCTKHVLEEDQHQHAMNWNMAQRARAEPTL